MKIKFAVLLFIVCVACTKAPEKSSHEFETIASQDLKFDLVLPVPLMDMIIKGAPITMNTNKSAYDLFDPLVTHIQITQNHADVLNGKSYQFDFKDFGGSIDWNSYLNRNENGSFNVLFNFTGTGEGEMKVFFLSWTKEFTHNDEVFGNGCNTVMDVTTYFKKTIFKEGLLLHTKDARYFYVTAGRFYFVFYAKDKIQISQVTFEDSNLKNKLCENPL